MLTDYAGCIRPGPYIYLSAIDVLRKIEGASNDSVDLHRIGRALGRTLHRKGKHAEAISYLDASLRFFEARYSRTHAVVIPIRLELLEALSASGQLQANDPLLVEDFALDELSEAHRARWLGLIAKHGEHSP